MCMEIAFCESKPMSEVFYLSSAFNWCNNQEFIAQAGVMRRIAAEIGLLVILLFVSAMTTILTVMTTMVLAAGVV